MSIDRKDLGTILSFKYKNGKKGKKEKKEGNPGGLGVKGKGENGQISKAAPKGA